MCSIRFLESTNIFHIHTNRADIASARFALGISSLPSASATATRPVALYPYPTTTAAVPVAGYILHVLAGHGPVAGLVCIAAIAPNPFCIYPNVHARWAKRRPYIRCIGPLPYRIHVSASVIVNPFAVIVASFIAVVAVVPVIISVTVLGLHSSCYKHHCHQSQSVGGKKCTAHSIMILHIWNAGENIRLLMKSKSLTPDWLWFCKKIV